MKRVLLICLMLPYMIFAEQVPLGNVCSKDTVVKTLYAYKKIKDSRAYDSDSIKRGIEVLQVGCMVIEHPIAKLIGVVLELASVGLDAYEMLKESFFSEEYEHELVYHDVFIPERFYFEVMRKKLQNVKQDFIQILDIVCDTYNLQKYDFESSFDHFAISIFQEVVYNDLQKKYLRIAREKELYNLQKDIIDLQYQIAWHVSHVISDRSEALRDVKKVFEHVVHTQSAIQHSLHTGTKGQLVDLYAQELYLKHIVNIYLQHQAKLLLLIDFFKKSSHADVLKQTSNIMDVIAHVEFEIITCDFMAYLKDSL